MLTNLPDWRMLTSQHIKFTTYRREQHLTRGWSAAVAALGPSAAAVLQRTAVAVFRPDGLRARRIVPGVEFIESCGLTPVFTAEVEMPPQISALIWKYQWDGASEDRIELVKTMLASGPSLLVAFRDPAEAIELPACVRLSARKGSGHPHERKGGELRSAIGSPNRVMTLAHILDEPADILRESDILLSPDQRDEMFRALGSGSRLSVADVAISSAQVDLDGARALERNLKVIAEWTGGTTPGARESLIGMLVAARAGTPLPWRTFQQELARAGIPLPLWDQLAMGAAFIGYDSTSATAIIPNSGLQGWLTGQGLLLQTAAAPR